MSEHPAHHAAAAADAAPKPSSLPILGAGLFILLWGVLVVGFFAAFLPVPPRL